MIEKTIQSQNRPLILLIKENSWDNHYIYLKYKGYPLVEKFYIEETEDGRYIVDQYTASEYDSVYLEEHK